MRLKLTLAINKLSLLVLGTGLVVGALAADFEAAVGVDVVGYGPGVVAFGSAVGGPAGAVAVSASVVGGAAVAGVDLGWGCCFWYCCCS